MESSGINLENGTSSSGEGKSAIEVSSRSSSSAKTAPQRIGVVLAGLESANLNALRFLVLQVNSLQSTFEFEFLPSLKHKFLTQLKSSKALDRPTVRTEAPLFAKDYRDFLLQENVTYKLKQAPPDYFIVISLATFSDTFYSARSGPVSIIALGNWEAVMAPPSILEFILTIVMREAVASISQQLRSSVHLGTKGCICDFNSNLDEVRIKVLSAFVCSYCSSALMSAGYANVPDEIRHVLGKKWLGKVSDPGSPAAIIAKLGYNLFLTKGLSATLKERVLATLQEEGVKQLVGIIGAVVIAALLLWLGLKPPN